MTEFDSDYEAVIVKHPGPFAHPRANNDEKSLDIRCLEGIERCREWKYMPAHVTRKLTLAQRIHRAEMLKLVREAEAVLGFPV